MAQPEQYRESGVSVDIIVQDTGLLMNILNALEERFKVSFQNPNGFNTTSRENWKAFFDLNHNALQQIANQGQLNVVFTLCDQLNISHGITPPELSRVIESTGARANTLVVRVGPADITAERGLQGQQHTEILVSLINDFLSTALLKGGGIVNINLTVLLSFFRQGVQQRDEWDTWREGRRKRFLELIDINKLMPIIQEKSLSFGYPSVSISEGGHYLILKKN